MTILTIDIDLVNHETQIIPSPQLGRTDVVGLSLTKKVNLSSFSIQIKINDMILSYPPKGITLMSTDQDCIHFFDFIFVPEKNYNITVEYEYKGNIYSSDHQFTGTIPVSPYPSWIWTGYEWKAPIPLPNDAGDIQTGELYEWHEDDLQWVPLGGYKVE